MYPCFSRHLWMAGTSRPSAGNQPSPPAPGTVVTGLPPGYSSGARICFAKPYGPDLRRRPDRSGREKTGVSPAGALPGYIPAGHGRRPVCGDHRTPARPFRPRMRGHPLHGHNRNGRDDATKNEGDLVDNDFQSKKISMITLSRRYLSFMPALGCCLWTVRKNRQEQKKGYDVDMVMSHGDSAVISKA
jgi:hypothetical protein